MASSTVRPRRWSSPGGLCPARGQSRACRWKGALAGAASASAALLRRPSACLLLCLEGLGAFLPSSCGGQRPLPKLRAAAPPFPLALTDTPYSGVFSHKPAGGGKGLFPSPNGGLLLSLLLLPSLAFSQSAAESEHSCQHPILGCCYEALFPHAWELSCVTP